MRRVLMVTAFFATVGLLGFGIAPHAQVQISCVPGLCLGGGSTDDVLVVINGVVRLRVNNAGQTILHDLVVGGTCTGCGGGGSGGSFPLSEVVYGTGSGATSDSQFLRNLTALTITPSDDVTVTTVVPSPAGATSYDFYVVAHVPGGGNTCGWCANDFGDPGAGVEITNGPAAPDGSHSIDITWAAVTGATSYDIYEDDVPFGLVATVSAPTVTYHFTGGGDSSPIYPNNTTGALSASSLAVTGLTVLGSETDVPDAGFTATGYQGRFHFYATNTDATLTLAVGDADAGMTHIADISGPSGSINFTKDVSGNAITLTASGLAEVLIFNQVELFAGDGTNSINVGIYADAPNHGYFNSSIGYWDIGQADTSVHGPGNGYFHGFLQPVGGYNSGDGTAGMTGSCGAATTAAIKNGLVVSCS